MKASGEQFGFPTQFILHKYLCTIFTWSSAQSDILTAQWTECNTKHRGEEEQEKEEEKNTIKKIQLRKKRREATTWEGRLMEG